MQPLEGPLEDIQHRATGLLKAPTKSSDGRPLTWRCGWVQPDLPLLGYLSAVLLARKRAASSEWGRRHWSFEMYEAHPAAS